MTLPTAAISAVVGVGAIYLVVTVLLSINRAATECDRLGGVPTLLDRNVVTFQDFFTVVNCVFKHEPGGVENR